MQRKSFLYLTLPRLSIRTQLILIVGIPLLFVAAIYYGVITP